MILLYVTFIVVMLLWAYSIGVPPTGPASSWLAWIAVLLLGIAIFITGTWPNLR